MCRNAQAHKEMMKTVKHLDTLEGHLNRRRRILKDIHTEQDGKCHWCGIDTYLWWEVTTEEFKKLDTNSQATQEHMTPQSHGGGWIDNITCACYECNQLRGNIEQNQFKWVTQNPERLIRYKTKRAENVLKNKANRRLRKYIRMLNRRSLANEENFNNQLIRSMNDISLHHKRRVDQKNKKPYRKMSEHQANIKKSCAEKNMNQLGKRYKKTSMTKAAIKRKNDEYKARIAELQNSIVRDKAALVKLSWFDRLVNRMMGECNAKSNEATA